jgi:hypothetical protein
VLRALPLVAAIALHPPIADAPGLSGRPVDGLRCSPAGGARFGAHVELFVHREIVLLPAGIGLARPWRRRGRWLESERCAYPVRTREPTGLIEVRPGAPRTLGDLFSLWGQPLGRDEVAGFRGRRVAAFLAGRRWRGSPAQIPLSPHAQIVIEIAGFVPPHRTYRFPRGL